MQGGLNREQKSSGVTGTSVSWGGLRYHGKQPGRLVEVIQPWLFRFICHFLVTVFTFRPGIFQGVFYNIMTKIQSCAGSCHGLKIYLSESQRWLCQWRYESYVSQGMATRCLLNLPASGVRPSNFSVYDALSPHVPGTILHRAKAAVGPCWALQSAHQPLPQRLSQFRPAQQLSSHPPGPSLVSRPLSLSLTPKSWLQLPSPWDTLSQDCGTWPTFLQAEERWGGFDRMFHSLDLCPTFLFRLLVSCSAAGSLVFPRTGLIAPSFSPMTPVSSPASPSFGSPEIFLYALTLFCLRVLVPLSRKTMTGGGGDESPPPVTKGPSNSWGYFHPHGWKKRRNSEQHSRLWGLSYKGLTRNLGVAKLEVG